ncbi:MAG: tail-specific protease [Gammaproteobacteria bacterium]|nr:MAG: tail-specific protease [Gammaproteobacteria bacterium]RLA53356.1 MAG: tail-specific protease [Gammaproteobacteria bacterium]
MKKASCLLFSLCIACLANASLEPLEYTNIQAQTSKEIIAKLSKNHYRKLKVDDELSALLFDNYLDNLDPLKSYLMQADIDELSPARATLDDALLKADLSLGFEIFNRFRLRMDQRLTANITLLESDYKFDFSKDETLLLDRKQRQWAVSKKAADDYWRKRMKDGLLRLTLSGKDLPAARELLIKRYQSQINQLNQQDSEDAFQFFTNALTEIYDPHTSYLSPRTLENFNITMSLSLEGIGAVLQREDELTKIVRIVPGGPADKEATLRAGDKIIGVAQGKKGEMSDIIGWRLDKVVEQIRGKKDTVVRLEILTGAVDSADKSQIVTIIRDKVRLEEQAAQSEVIELSADQNEFRVGVIKVPAFYMDFETYRKRDPNFKSTTRDVRQLLLELEDDNVQGIILDLRNNGGGSLLEATALTDLFIAPGPVVQIRHANQHITRNQRSHRRPFYDGPLVVLVNCLSASASEIFAGAIQDYGRGLILGGTSFGKGTVQVMAPLKHGQLKFTESKFYRVSGNSTQHRGVIPDIKFPSYCNRDDISESSQEYALPWDSIHAVPHAKHHNIKPQLAELKVLHDKRISGEPDWQFMLAEIDLLHQQQNIEQLTLNQEKRKGLQDERERKMLLIENKRRKELSQEPFSTFVELREFRKESKDDDDKADPMLKEAGMLLLDFVSTNSQSSSRVVSSDADGQAVVY